MKNILMTVTISMIAFIFWSFTTQNKELKSSPNVILIYMDDMGYGDIGRNGALSYQTPHMDAMAMSGASLTHYYSPQAVCTASRAGILTGCYPNRIGFHGAIDHTAKIGIHPDEETIAELLKAKGYQTAVFGKWHLGHKAPFLPLYQGFDTYYGIPYSHDMWPFHPVTKDYYPDLPLIDGNKTIETNPDISQFTKVFTEKTVSYIKQHKNKPFFIYLAHPLPHVPLAVSDAFKGKSSQGLYGDVMMELDWSIGQVRKTLKDLKLDKNTLLIVTSDNGPWLNYGNHAGSTGGLREGKGTTFEGGQRVPCLIEWPDRIPKGILLHHLITGLDLLPTIVAATGASLPKKKIDGISMLPIWEGKTNENLRKTFLYYYRQNNLEAVRHEDWKLIFSHPGRTYQGFEPGKDGQPGGANENFAFDLQLYDLRRDPGERYNVIESYPEIVKQLNAIADVARKDLGDRLTNTEGANNRPIGKIE